MLKLSTTWTMTTLAVGLIVLLVRPLGTQSEVGFSAGRPSDVASTMQTARGAIIGDCGISRAGSGGGDVDYVMVYKSDQSIVCVDREFWANPQNASAIPRFFPYFDAVIAQDKVLFPVVPTKTQFVFKITTPTGGAATGCGFSKWGLQSTFCNTVTGDAFTSALKDPISGELVQGFWGYLLPLHESINVFTGLLSSGWPMDWWADHRSPFPNAMDAVFMQSIADNSAALDPATKRSLRASARLQLERFTDPENHTGKYDTEVVMFLDFFNKYGGFKAYADTFRYAIVQDGLRWTSVSKDRNFTGDDNYSENLSEYVIAYLHLGLGVSSNLTSAFRSYGVGTLDKRVRPYEIAANNVKAIADAHCSIRSAVNAGFKVGHELSELRKGNFKTAQASGGTSTSCPSECVFSDNKCMARF
jgi:hypothetical protein